MRQTRLSKKQKLDRANVQRPGRAKCEAKTAKTILLSLPTLLIRRYNFKNTTINYAQLTLFNRAKHHGTQQFVTHAQIIAQIIVRFKITLLNGMMGAAH